MSYEDVYTDAYNDELEKIAKEKKRGFKSKILGAAGSSFNASMTRALPAATVGAVTGYLISKGSSAAVRNSATRIGGKIGVIVALPFTALKMYNNVIKSEKKFQKKNNSIN